MQLTFVPIVRSRPGLITMGSLCRPEPSPCAVRHSWKVFHRSRSGGAGTIRRSQLREIAEIKMKDLNANDLDAASKIIEGSARAMGLDVVEG